MKARLRRVALAALRAAWAFLLSPRGSAACAALGVAVWEAAKAAW
jgi:hypothetical protein